MLKYLLAAGVGAALAYFLDPGRGAQRREAAAKQLSDIAQRSANHEEDVAQHRANTAQELSERTADLKIEAIIIEDLPAADSLPYSAAIQNTHPYH